MEYKWIAAKRRKVRKNDGYFAPFALLCGQFFSRFVVQVADSSVNNANGTVTEQPIMVLDQQFDPINWEFNSPSFQAFDVSLALGLNTITLHATDLAGNVTTVATGVTLSYANKPAPMVQLVWPANGMTVCGSSFTLHGLVSDPTASVTTQISNPDGSTTLLNSLVGRDGGFYIYNLPLNAGVNNYAVNATDAAGNVATASLSVTQGSVGLAIDPIPPNQTTVTGEINADTFTVWVNGVKASMSSSVNGNGVYTWEADNVPIPPNGSLVEVTAIPNSDNGGYGSWVNGGGQ
jgi:hypothetical protein